MESLDPRISRLDKSSHDEPKNELDQLETYEVFVQQREGKPYRHEGVVHASDEEMAFVFAKEQFSRRLTCYGIWVVKTSNVFVSEFTDDDENVYQHFAGSTDGGKDFEVFHLLKRGKQHLHAGTVEADIVENAFIAASNKFHDTSAYNIWIVASDDLYRSHSEDVDIWSTLPEKKFRDAIAYRAGDKLKNFLENRRL